MSIVLLWDIDGTLLTTDRAGIAAWEGAVLEQTGVGLDLASERTAGLTDGQIAAALLERCGADAGAAAVATLLRRYEALLPDALAGSNGRVLGGVVEILSSLPAPPVVRSLLLTGNTAAGARAKLERFGLAAYFAAGGAFCIDAGPRAEIARRARALATGLAGVGLDDENVFVVGDTPHDIACAQAIRARTIAVATGGYDSDSLERAGAWKVLETLPPPDGFAALIGLVGEPR